MSKAGKNLVIVESPAKATTIERYLGADYTVLASYGHVRDLPAKTKKGSLSIDIEHGFTPTYEVIEEKVRRLDDIKKAAKKASAIWLATDLDREGEAIAWHVAESLDIPEGDRRRVTFSEITKGAILDAFSHPRAINQDLVNAQQARRILDRLVGYRLSPLLSRLIKPKLSAGRVQSVALRLVVERERAIRALDPHDTGAQSGQVDGVGLDHVVVLPVDPVLAGHVRRAEDAHERIRCIRHCTRRRDGVEIEPLHLIEVRGPLHGPPIHGRLVGERGNRQLGHDLSPIPDPD